MKKFAMKSKVHTITKEFSKHAHINESQYHEMYARSLKDPEGFWGEQAEKFISWFKPWKKVLTGDFKNLNVEWFVNGKLNACYNCVDRHLPKRANQTALLWEGNNPNESIKKRIWFKKNCQLKTTTPDIYYIFSLICFCVLFK